MPKSLPKAMHRRTFLKTLASAGGFVAAGGYPAPAISQGVAKTLRFVPQSNLAVKRHRTRDQDRRRRVDHSLGCGAAAPSLEARSAA